MTLSPEFIESEYRRLGFELGWRFLTCPEKNIEGASVALVTINLAGDVFEPARWSVENGSAYVVESWKGRPRGEEDLQRQVRRMFEIMNADPTDVLSGYLVPFRSREWDELPHKEESLEIGVGLWREIFKRTRAKLIIAFGKNTGPYLSEILNARLVTKWPANWSTYTIDEYHFGIDGKMLVLPHLSRFKLFSSQEATTAFRAALAATTTDLATMAVTAHHYPERGQRIIRLLAKENPKRGKSRLRFDCYRDRMTESEYEMAVRRKLGAEEARKCRLDLEWDSDPKRHFIRFEG